MWRATVWLMAIVALAGCAKLNRYDNLQVVSLEAVKPVARADDRPRLGIAFGGGGVRGLAHLGVMRALDEAGIRADVVTGTSAGAAAAALYASGSAYKDIEARVLSASEFALADPVLSTRGLLNGQSYAAWIRESVGGRHIENLPIPLAVTVTDIGEGEALLITSGDVGEAVQASASVPVSVIPVESGGRTLIDGGVLSLVPIRAARALGADVVIGIDIYCGKETPVKGHAIDTMLRTFRLQICRVSEREIAEADILIRPDFEPASLFDAVSLGERDAAIEAGYRAVHVALPALQRTMKSR